MVQGKNSEPENDKKDLKVNIVFIVPTGIGAEIGGHAGDATPSAKLIASVCDNLFVHPNVVNASDLNEMAENMLYVEGSILDRFLEGETGLERVHANKILVIVNDLTPEIINSVSGARATIGADIEIVELETPIKMVATSRLNGEATGDVDGIKDAISQIRNCEFDVLIVNTPIETEEKKVKEYLTKSGGVNLWGGVEAKLSKKMSWELNKPVIHAPVENSEAFRAFNEVTDPRKAAEMVSVCYLHCCLKGGHLAPRMSEGRGAFWNTDIDFLISPINVFGRPHSACKKNKIPIIAIKENRTILNDEMPDDVIIAENYLEAAGIVASKKAGVTISSVRRPLNKTKFKKREWH